MSRSCRPPCFLCGYEHPAAVYCQGRVWLCLACGAFCRRFAKKLTMEEWGQVKRVWEEIRATYGRR